jgi:hypothetical protein
MPNNFQIFLFKIEGIAETKPSPLPPPRLPPPEATAQLSQAATDLFRVAALLSQAAASASPVTIQLNDLAKELSSLVRQVSDLSGKMRDPEVSAAAQADLVAELEGLASRLYQIDDQLPRAIAQQPPVTAQVNQAATELSQLATRLFQTAAQLSRPAAQRSDISTDENSVRELNEKADETAQNLQREIARLLRSSASVQAEIRFYEGSIIFEGTISLIYWLAPIVLASARKAFEDGLTHIIGVATRRVLQPVLRERAPQAEPLRNIEVTPQPVVSAATPSAARSLPSFLQRIPTFDSSGLFLLFMTLTSLTLLVLIILLIIILVRGSPQGIRLNVNTRRTEIFVAPAGALSPVVVRNERTAVSPPVHTRCFYSPASRTS